MHDMNEKVWILNLEAENCDEDKIEVFALPPLLNWALIPVIAQLEAERLWPWSWELWMDAITETLILPHCTLVWVGFLGQIMEKTFCCKYRANGINELASLLNKLKRLREVKPEGM